MKIGTLSLDERKIIYAKSLGKKIADDVLEEIKPYTTKSIERAILRIFGVNGVNSKGIPYVNSIIDKFQEKNLISKGILFLISNALIKFNTNSIQRLIEEIDEDKINITKLEYGDKEKIKILARDLIKDGVSKIVKKKKERENMILKYPLKEKPHLYVIVATGNIYEDAKQVKSAAYLGADFIAIIRSTAQSLLDYVPYGLTTEGYGGTYATQENFRFIREILDEVSKDIKKYVKLVNYSSGLCMPEISTLATLERLDLMVNDALYGILFRNLNPLRTMIDQRFSRFILHIGGIPIVTGEDNLIKTIDSKEFYYTVIVSQIINEQLAKNCGMDENEIGLGHAFELDPNLENGFLYEIAQAQLVRELFPNSPIKFMPPTRYKTGNIFLSHVMDTLFNIVANLTDQEIQLLGMLTEALHTPLVHDRYLSIENAKYIRNNLKSISNEFIIKDDGIIKKRAVEVFDKAVEKLEEISSMGLFKALEKGYFSDTKRLKEEGRGYEGVIKKDDDYLEIYDLL
ncbi:MAG: lysine 5,6-aminomutase subunit alpha TIM-barrel domain-containing protein [Caldisericia bacterium]